MEQAFSIFYCLILHINTSTDECFVCCYMYRSLFNFQHADYTVSTSGLWVWLNVFSVFPRLSKIRKKRKEKNQTNPKTKHWTLALLHNPHSSAPLEGNVTGM